MTVSAADHRARVEARLAAVDRFVYRNRHVFAPLGLGVLLVVVGEAGHLTGWWGWLSVWILATLWWAIAWDITLDQPTVREKWYSFGVATCGALWVSLVARYGLGTLLAIAGGVLLVGFGIPWAVHRRVRRGVEVDRAINAWGDGSAVGLTGTRARGTKAGEGWFSFKLRANEHGRYTLRSYKDARARIAALFGVRAEAISFASSEHEGEVEVTVRQAARETQHAAASTEARSIVGAEPVGSTDDGTPIDYAMSIAGHGGLHSVAVGVTGSGKSGLINVGAQRVVAAPDAVLCMVDLSPGAQELKAWRPVCYWFADTIAEAERLFTWLNAVTEDRGRRSTSRLFEPSEQAPQISVWVDEAATMFAPDLVEADSGGERDAEKAADRRALLVEQGVRVYRKYGIDLHLATQYGDVRALGGSTIQQQLGGGYVAVFRCLKNTDAHRVVPASKGLQPAELPANKPGSLFLSGMTIDGTAQGRLRYLGDDAIAETVDYWGPRQPLPEPELRALCGDKRTGTAAGTSGDFAGQHQSPAGDKRTDGAGNGTRHGADAAANVPNFAAAESPRGRQRLSPEQSRQMVLNTLRGFPEGATVADIAGVCGKSVPLVQGRLNELADIGLATSKGRRKPRWRATSL